jgi:hypothetical protein
VVPGASATGDVPSLVGTSYAPVDGPDGGTLIVGDWDSGDPTSINAFTLRVTVPELGRTVPEPDSFALMLAGLGALGWALRGKHG